MQPSDQEQEEAKPRGILGLPPEMLLQILSFLEPSETTNLQLACKKLLSICRDNTFWRSICFEESTFLQNLRRRQQLLGHESSFEVINNTAAGSTVSHAHNLTNLRIKERKRILANWDPSYEGENVNWYDEYIQRNAPVAVNWLQQPLLRDGTQSTYIEARGLALYRPDNPDQEPHGLETILAVAPLDDGSVCLWDVTGAKGRKGALVARSRPGILHIDASSGDDSITRSKRIDSGVTECVSVDSKLHLAFFAVQSHLIEVDLQRLAVVGCESFPWSITALSATDPWAPLTVGTNAGIHLHDFRSRPASWRDGVERLDGSSGFGAKELYEKGLKALFDDTPLPPYAPLAHPAPLSILHMRRPGTAIDMADEIFVAGRFPSILLYDRRMFPSIKGSIHSGARLCSLSSIAGPFSTLDSELRREGQLSLEQLEMSKRTPSGGRTLLAFGEYKTKGSLEVYGLQPSPSLPTSLQGGLAHSVFKNRQSSSDSKILSGTTQGTRLVFSDGSGRIKWFERDGFTEVRREQVGHCERTQDPSIFTSMPGSDDIARKLLPTQDQPTARVNDNDLLFWTGENIGLVSFTSSPAFGPEGLQEEARSAAELEKESEERIHGENMRRALERQADDVRFVRNLGLGV
ncbi:hypothetical protein M406DRAFT_340097 [Cryphonectria parasitica EP155]|uniref:F-box domain-containing protein n=1 Tax=Cryphonectria parasitica (strain ATCC 38755 / EP155) TaxID=660469 RepID=A0A9P4Y1M4_CRYP1|nr:uncharacterized protein M406DRAFT_340097 [Cryphonectria parasitica EP155]KAF3764505.1 hypothetical protein M406DRAFT_340097 [Cryphonectria parasitica EP155]